MKEDSLTEHGDTERMDSVNFVVETIRVDLCVSVVEMPNSDF